MLPKTPSYLLDMPIYKKALEIFSLSRRISSYLNYDLAPLKELLVAIELRAAKTLLWK